jgi:hypothetical protein
MKVAAQPVAASRDSAVNSSHVSLDTDTLKRKADPSVVEPLPKLARGPDEAQAKFVKPAGPTAHLDSELDATVDAVGPSGNPADANPAATSGNELVAAEKKSTPSELDKSGADTSLDPTNRTSSAVKNAIETPGQPDTAGLQRSEAAPTLPAGALAAACDGNVAATSGAGAVPVSGAGQSGEQAVQTATSVPVDDVEEEPLISAAGQQERGHNPSGDGNDRQGKETDAVADTTSDALEGEAMIADEGDGQEDEDEDEGAVEGEAMEEEDQQGGEGGDDDGGVVTGTPPMPVAPAVGGGFSDYSYMEQKPSIDLTAEQTLGQHYDLTSYHNQVDDDDDITYGVGIDGDDDSYGIAIDDEDDEANDQSIQEQLDASRAKVDEQQAVEKEIFTPYTCPKLPHDYFVAHCGEVVETSTLAAVEPPDVTHDLLIPESVLREGRLSDLQAEAVIYAGQRHTQFLADGKTRGAPSSPDPVPRFI